MVKGRNPVWLTARLGPGRVSQGGSVIILVIFFIALTAFIPMAIHLQTMLSRNTGRHLSYDVQARDAARAGLTDALMWFRRQSFIGTQSPSTADSAFHPFGPPQHPDRKETVNEDLGLVKQYALDESNQLWVRYEVVRQSLPYATTADPNYNPHAVHDISNQRLENKIQGAGLVWYVESVGYVFRGSSDPTLRPDQYPNKLLSTAHASTEFRHLDINVDAISGALNALKGTSVHMYYNARIFAATPGPTFGSRDDNTCPITAAPAELVPQTCVRLAPDSFDLTTLFGVSSIPELKRLADFSVSKVSDLPVPYPSSAFVFLDASNLPGATADFDGHQLHGGGMLCILGNAVFRESTDLYFSGVITVSGDLTVFGPTYIAGTVAAAGTVQLIGISDGVEVHRDPYTLENVKSVIGSYRQDNSTLIVNRNNT